jgi:DNA invertase Pin-like site-specific DNA recombinase
MKVALYARVSTDDKNQEPETQLLQLRDYCQRQGWEIFDEFHDYAPAADLGKRVAWRMMLDQAAIKEFDLLLVFRLDRAFRSVLEGVQTLERLKAWDIGFRSYSEPYIDTTTVMGEAMFTISAAWAQLERGIIGERVKAGMARAAAEGKAIGRPGLEINGELVVQLRVSGMSWAKIARAHPQVAKSGGRRGKPSAASIRRAFRHYSGHVQTLVAD